MSSSDGALAVRVDVEHLPDRRYRLWLGEPYPRTDLGTVDRSSEIDGGRVVVVDPRYGRRVAGTVVTWVDGGVWVDTGKDSAGGVYAAETVTFLPEDRPDPDDLT